MNRMTGLILMISGVLIFALGIFMFRTSTAKNDQPDKSDELNNVIDMAIADGVLTANERNVIKQISTKKGLDFDEIINDAEKQLADLKIDSETELIDYNKKKGDDFEKFVVRKFDKKFFSIKEWAGDKYVNGIYANTTPQPDMLIEFKLKQETTNFSVECKWRQKLFKNGIEFATEEQFERYKRFEQKQQHPVFIVIGVGGKALSPEKLYVVPLKELAGNFIPIAKLKRYEKYMDSNFFFNPETKELR